MKSLYFVSNDAESDSQTILRVCNELPGYRINVYQCYDEVLEDDVYVCRSAKPRKSKYLIPLT